MYFGCVFFSACTLRYEIVCWREAYERSAQTFARYLASAQLRGSRQSGSDSPRWIVQWTNRLR